MLKSAPVSSLGKTQPYGVFEICPSAAECTEQTATKNRIAMERSHRAAPQYDQNHLLRLLEDHPAAPPPHVSTFHPQHPLSSFHPDKPAPWIQPGRAALPAGSAHPPGHREAPRRAATAKSSRDAIPARSYADQQMRLSLAERMQPQLEVARRQNQKLREQLKVLTRHNRTMTLVVSRMKAQQQLAADHEEMEDGDDDAGILSATVEEERHRRETLAREMNTMRGGGGAAAELHRLYGTGAARRVTPGYRDAGGSAAAFEAAMAATHPGGGGRAPQRAAQHRAAPHLRSAKGGKAKTSSELGTPGSPASAESPGSGSAAVASLASFSGLAAEPPAQGSMAYALAESERARAALQVLVQGLEAELALVRGQLAGHQQQTAQAHEAHALALAQHEAEDLAGTKVDLYQDRAEAMPPARQIAELRRALTAAEARAAAAELAVREASVERRLDKAAPLKDSGGGSGETEEGHMAKIQQEANERIARAEAAGAEAALALQGQVDALTSRCVEEAAMRRKLEDRLRETAQSHVEALTARKAALAAAEAAAAAARQDVDTVAAESMAALQAQVDALTAKCVDDAALRSKLEQQLEEKQSTPPPPPVKPGELIVPWAAALQTLRANRGAASPPPISSADRDRDHDDTQTDDAR